MVTVSIAQGVLKGNEGSTENGFKYYEFLNIPYAKPPVGELRFKSPEPPKSWEGVRDATKWDPKHIGYQYEMITGQLIGSEDCLYLNVYTPRLPTSNLKPLPVMVYIHGGGFVFGSGINKNLTGPDYLIEHDVIVVVINYRLGLLGFLSLDIPEATGNMGLKDQVKALQWVRNNIENFGGDKRNVTVFGISAGSASVEYHLISPRSKGLFDKAIAQSGSTLNDWAFTTNMKDLIVKVLEQLKYAGSQQDNRAIYEFLLNSPADVLVKTAIKIARGDQSKMLYFGFVPTIEKDFGDAFLTCHPYKLLKEGKVHHVPMIRGFCRDEGAYIGAANPVFFKEFLEKKNFTDYFPFEINVSDKDTYNKLLTEIYINDVLPVNDKSKFALDFFGDLQFSSGVWLSGKFLHLNEFLIYMYKFSYRGNSNMLSRLYKIDNAVTHGDDMGYIFRHSELTAPSETDLIMRRKMTKLWTNFAKTGNPTPNNEEKQLRWPTYSEEFQVLIIDKECTIESSYKPNKMAIFEELYEKYAI